MKYGTLFNACPRSQGAGTPSEKEKMDSNKIILFVYYINLGFVLPSLKIPPGT